MAARALDAHIDQLYQLPLDDFTAARNTLAKGAGADAATIRALQKPPIAAWAVNQLYWRERTVWDALIAAAEEARRTHKAALSGHSADIRAANKVHDEAVETASRTTLTILTEAGHPRTDATRQAVVTTLRALPGDEAPGRLTRSLQPVGFEALAGLSVGRGAPAPKPSSAPVARAAPARAGASARPKIDHQALARARAAVASADRMVREAEQADRREEFEVVKTRRDETRATETAAQAKEALTRARTELEEAQAGLTAATRQREAAEKRARQAKDTLAKARDRAGSEAAALKKIEKG